MKTLKYIVIAFMWVFAIYGLVQSCSNHPHPDSINHPDNAEFVNEVAFNLGIDPEDVTQEQFDARYSD